jgi:hypothetical protein
MLRHPWYSPDLIPGDFFSKLKESISCGKSMKAPVAAGNIFGWVGSHFNVITSITFFIMFVVIVGKEFLC